MSHVEDMTIPTKIALEYDFLTVLFCMDQVGIAFERAQLYSTLYYRMETSMNKTLLLLLLLPPSWTYDKPSDGVEHVFNQLLTNNSISQTHPPLKPTFLCVMRAFGEEFHIGADNHLPRNSKKHLRSGGHSRGIGKTNRSVSSFHRATAALRNDGAKKQHPILFDSGDRRWPWRGRWSSIPSFRTVRNVCCQCHHKSSRWMQ